MRHIEDRIAVYQQYADKLYKECSDIYKEKEKIYLKGTHFLRLRVLNSMLEEFKGQMRSKMQQLLQESNGNNAELEERLAHLFDQYMARFWQHHAETDDVKK